MSAKPNKWIVEVEWTVVQNHVVTASDAKQAGDAIGDKIDQGKLTIDDALQGTEPATARITRVEEASK
jgi:hypothetical protein